MYGPQVTRTPLEIRTNTLPPRFLGRWLMDVFRTEIKVKSAFDDQQVMLEVSPVMIVVDKETSMELFRFQTAITFTFSGARSTYSIHSLAHYMVCLSIDEFNNALLETKSTLSFGRKYEHPSIQEIESLIKPAFDATNPGFKQVPRHWKRFTTKTYRDPEDVMNELPALPVSKQYHAQYTEEIYTVNRYCNKEAPTLHDENVLKECISFYKSCIDKLRQVNLCSLSDDQALRLLDYLARAFTVQVNLYNEIETGDLYRVTVVAPEFREAGKIREAAFLSAPPVEVNRKRGVYGRANTPETTVFYASTLPNVAVRETKPKPGARIVLTKWNCGAGVKLNAYPLTLTAGISNEFSNRASYAFEELCKTVDPLYGEYMECLLSFLGNEFIQENPSLSKNGYEYLYSSFFAERLLSEMPKGSPVKTFDCIVYPSVAWNHVPDNFAIRTEVIEKHYTITSAQEFIVHNTWYDRDIQSIQLPAQLELVRTLKEVKHGHISWDDDE